MIALESASGRQPRSGRHLGLFAARQASQARSNLTPSPYAAMVALAVPGRYGVDTGRRPAWKFVRTRE